MRDYSEFLRALNGQSGRVSLAEPFIPRVIAEQLIWRRGAQLWDSAEHYIDTLCELYAYVKSDVVFVDARAYNLRELIERRELLPEGMKFVVIIDRTSEIFALMDDSICAVMTDELDIVERVGTSRERGRSLIFGKPCVYLCRASGDAAKDDILSASERGFMGVYLPRIDERLFEFAAEKSVVLLGGVGVDAVNHTQPLDIYNRVEWLTEHRLRLIGSGGFGEPVEYLGFISLLGKYQKLL